MLALGAWLLAAGRLSEGTFLLAFQLSNGLNAFASTFDLLASAWQYLRGAQWTGSRRCWPSAPVHVTDGRMVPASVDRAGAA